MKVTDNGHKTTIKKLDLYLKTYSQYNKKKPMLRAQAFSSSFVCILTYGLGAAAIISSFA